MVPVVNDSLPSLTCPLRHLGYLVITKYYYDDSSYRTLFIAGLQHVRNSYGGNYTSIQRLSILASAVEHAGAYSSYPGELSNLALIEGSCSSFFQHYLIILRLRSILFAECVSAPTLI